MTEYVEVFRVVRGGVVHYYECGEAMPIARLSALTDYEKDQLRELGYDESDIEYMTVEDTN